MPRISPENPSFFPWASRRPCFRNVRPCLRWPIPPILIPSQPSQPATPRSVCCYIFTPIFRIEENHYFLFPLPANPCRIHSSHGNPSLLALPSSTALVIARSIGSPFRGLRYEVLLAEREANTSATNQNSKHSYTLSLKTDPHAQSQLQLYVRRLFLHCMLMYISHPGIISTRSQKKPLQSFFRLFHLPYRYERLICPGIRSDDGDGGKSGWD